MFAGEFCESLSFCGGGDTSGGVCGTVEDDEFCAGCDGVLNGFDGYAKVGVCGNRDNGAASEGHQVTVHHEPGVKDDDFFTGVKECEQSEHEGTAGTGRDKYSAIGVLVTLVDIILKEFEQRGDALSLAVGVAAFLNGAAEGIFNGLWCVVVGLPDAEIHWSWHACGEVKDFADTGGIDAMHAFSDP